MKQEFPVTFRQKIVTGKMPAGTHVQSNLIAATLVDGKVVPRNALLSGEVTESKAKTSSEPSRLSIRMDTAEWKGGSVPLHAYLTLWYYPMTLQAGPNLKYGPEPSDKKKWNGMGRYPDPQSPDEYKPFPSSAETDKQSAENNPSVVVSSHRAPMKDVDCQRDSAGGITLLGSRSDIKLDKLTTYVFGSGDLPAGNAH